MESSTKPLYRFGVSTALLGLIGWLCLVNLRESGAATDPLAPNVPEAAPDSGAACPVGYARVLFVQAFAIDSLDVSRLFERGQTSRVIKAGRDGHFGPSLRGRLRLLAKADRMALVGTGAFYLEYANTFRGALLKSGGDGIVISLVPTQSSSRMTICAARDTVGVRPAATCELRGHEALILLTDIEDCPNVVVLQAQTLRRSEVAAKQRRFRQGVIEVTDKAASGFYWSVPSGELLDCLRDAATH